MFLCFCSLLAYVIDDDEMSRDNVKIVGHMLEYGCSYLCKISFYKLNDSTGVGPWSCRNHFKQFWLLEQFESGLLFLGM